MENKFEMVAKTFQGLEDVLRDELIDLGAENVELGLRMVTFEGDNEILYKANLCCRTALRILKPIVKFTASTPDELYDYVRDLDWEQFMNVDSTFAIDSTVNSDDFTHSKFVTYRVKDGIADHFNDKYGRRPSIRLNGADLLLNVHISGDRVTISLDSSGEPLSRRGYRTEHTDAPINEVLAAGIIMKSGWRGDCDFLDPMCGSGTFLIEAALIAANINPGIYRESFAFEKWPDFDDELFREIYDDDSAEREFAYKIYGGDIDPDAVAIARKNIKNARVDDMVDLVCRPLDEWTDNAPEGVLVTNPPYGERLKPENISALYHGIGSALKQNFKGWHAWIIGYKEEQFSEIGLKPSLKIPLFNGNLECSLREYVMFDGKYTEFRADGGSIGNTPERREQQGPKKVKRISDDDWGKDAKKFNKSTGFGDDRKKKKSFSRDNDRNRDFPSGERGGGKPDFRKNRDDDRPYQNRDRNKPFRQSDRGERSFQDRDGNYQDRDRNRDGNFRDRDRNSRDRDRNRDRNFQDRDRNFQDRDRNRDRSYQDRDRNRDRKGGMSYDPRNSRGPGIPKSQETVINSVHMRKRRQSPREEESDE